MIISMIRSHRNYRYMNFMVSLPLSKILPHKHTRNEADQIIDRFNNGKVYMNVHHEYNRFLLFLPTCVL